MLHERTQVHHHWLRLSLVAVWLLTAWVSVLDAGGIGRTLLHSAGMDSHAGQSAVIYAGACWDLLIGLWLLFKPGRTVYVLALLGMLAMTLIATVLLPALWLHPLGVLSKNIPIAAALCVLINASLDQERRKP